MKKAIKRFFTNRVFTIPTAVLIGLTGYSFVEQKYLVAGILFVLTLISGIKITITRIDKENSGD